MCLNLCGEERHEATDPTGTVYLEVRGAVLVDRRETWSHVVSNLINAMNENFDALEKRAARARRRVRILVGITLEEIKHLPKPERERRLEGLRQSLVADADCPSDVLREVEQHLRSVDADLLAVS